MNFGDALEKLKSGYHIRRKEWKNIDYLCLSKNHEKPADGTETIIAMMKWDDPSCRAWMPGQRELLAEDWELALQVTTRIDGVTPNKLELHFTIDNKCICSPEELRRSLHEAMDKAVDSLAEGASNIG